MNLEKIEIPLDNQISARVEFEGGMPNRETVERLIAILELLKSSYPEALKLPASYGYPIWITPTPTTIGTSGFVTGTTTASAPFVIGTGDSSLPIHYDSKAVSDE